MYALIGQLGLLWGLIRTERVTASTVLSKTPAWLISAHLTSDAVGASTAAIYDGESAVEPCLVDLAALTSSYDSYVPAFPVPCQRGLFVSIGSNVKSVTVTYFTRKE